MPIYNHYGDDRLAVVTRIQVDTCVENECVCEHAYSYYNGDTLITGRNQIGTSQTGEACVIHGDNICGSCWNSAQLIFVSESASCLCRDNATHKYDGSTCRSFVAAQANVPVQPPESTDVGDGGDATRRGCAYLHSNATNISN